MNRSAAGVAPLFPLGRMGGGPRGPPPTQGEEQAQGLLWAGYSLGPNGRFQVISSPFPGFSCRTQIRISKGAMPD
jgi:hypothetical protein